MRPFRKIFGVGLSRTGTNSLNTALEVLGLSAVHFPSAFAEVEKHQAATDSPIAAWFEDLDLLFPGSLFILTVRNLDDWLRSVEKYWEAFDQFAGLPPIQRLHQQLYGSERFDRTLYGAAYEIHVAKVRRHFASRPDVLLEMDICGGCGWPPLCAFLEVPVPAEAFPNTYTVGPKTLVS
jgi:hypothetical protein